MRRAGAALAGVFLLALIARDLAAALPTGVLMDFGSFIASGQAAGQGLDPYGIYPLTFHVVLPGFESWNPNLNPPASLPLFQALARLDPHEGFRLWWAVSFLCHGAAVALLARRYRSGPRTILWAFALAGFWDTLVLGQIYTPLALVAVGAWLLLERDRPWAAGVLIGLLVAAKPNFAVWPALLLLAGHTRPVMAAAGSAALVAALPLALYGPEVYAQWLDLVLRDVDRAVFLTNASLSGLAQRVGWARLGTSASLALLAGAALWARRRRPSARDASAVGLVAAVLASPIAWVHYTLFLMPLYFALPWSRPLRLSAMLLIVPVPLVLAWLDAPWWQQASLGSVYGWAVVACLVALILPAEGRRTKDTEMARA